VAGNFQSEYEPKTLNDDKVVIDHTTALMWHQSGSSDAMIWNKAQEYINKLNRMRYAGFSDWRLPTIEELASLIEFTRKNDPLYIELIFDKTQKWCWSADKRTSSTAWVANYYYGSVDFDKLDNSNHFRGVRSVR
jgi:serine/threonine-protein kinase